MRQYYSFNATKLSSVLQVTKTVLEVGFGYVTEIDGEKLFRQRK